MQVLAGRRKKSNEKIIEQVIMEQYNQYYRLAYSYVHNEPDACDIVQNGAYKALRSSHTLRKQEYAATWVYRIMLNEIFGYLKQPKFESYERLREERGYEAEYIGEEYTKIDLQRALDSLPAQDKVIVTLKYFEDKKLDEIADILNENISTVKSKLYRSMKKLRIKLTDEPVHTKGGEGMI
ncbi:MAG: RNA polymerase sigma factor [Kineothrix sp.]